MVLLPTPFSPTIATKGKLKSMRGPSQPRTPLISSHSRRFGHDLSVSHFTCNLRISLLIAMKPPFCGARAVLKPYISGANHDWRRLLFVIAYMIGTLFVKFQGAAHHFE